MYLIAREFFFPNIVLNYLKSKLDFTTHINSCNYLKAHYAHPPKDQELNVNWT